MNEKKYLLDIIRDGKNKAALIATKTINEVYDIVGLVRNET